jgi:hypothetical protein
MVSASDIYRAGGILERLGYDGTSNPSERYYREHHHHVHFIRPEGPLIELHFRAYSGFGITVEAQTFLARARRYQPGKGPPTWVLAPEDEFVYLAAHVAGHLYLRLSWLYDLKLFLRRHPGLSGVEIAKRAKSLGLLKAVAYTAERLRDFGVAIDGLPVALNESRQRVAVGLLAVAQTADPNSARAHLARILFLSMLCDEPRARRSYLRHQLLRGARKLTHRYFPRWVPDEWSG